MKNLILTTAFGDDIYKTALPIHKLYCEKYKIDFIVIDSLKINYKNNQTYEKFQMIELFDEYDRILYLDADVLITPHCPDVFEAHDDIESFYAYHENDEGFALNRDHMIALSLQDYDMPFINWPLGPNGKLQYFNTGIFLASKCHKEDLKEVFEVESKLKSNWMYEQTVLNFIVAKNNIKFGHMDYSWNRMDLGKPDPECLRYNANFIHYAGNGYDTNNIGKYNVLRNDMKVLYGI